MPNQRNDARLELVLPAAEKRKFFELAEAEKKTPSALIRAAIMRMVRERIARAEQPAE